MIRHFTFPSMYVHLKQKTFKVLTVAEWSVSSNISTQEASGEAITISSFRSRWTTSVTRLYSLTSGSWITLSGPEGIDSIWMWRDTALMLAACWGDNRHQLERTIVTEWVKKGGGGKEELEKKRKTSLSQNTAWIMFSGFLNVTLINKPVWQ